MVKYKVYYGIEHLNVLQTSVSIAFDTETLQLQPEQGKLRLIQLACKSRASVVVLDCFELTQDDFEQVRRFFNTPRMWIAHNAVFDIAWLQEYGIYPNTLNTGIKCTMLANRLLTNGIPGLKHGLAAVCKKHLDIELSKEQQTSDWSAPYLSEEQKAYAAKDVEVLPDLYEVMERKLQYGQLRKAEILESRAIPALAQMWRTGLPWNAEALEQCRKDYEFDAENMGKEFLEDLNKALPDELKLPREGDAHVRITEIKDKLCEPGHDPETRARWYEEIEELEMEAFNLRAKDEGSVRLGTKKYKGFNLNSPKQLLEKFTAVLGEQPRDAKGKPSASRQALRSYTADHEVVHKYLQWKKTEKRRQMVTSIKEKMASDGFVRASYMQLGADTGRMSCIKPNNQQIPRDASFRQCVQAPKGWSLVDADYGQMELRLAAALAQDKNMASVFKEGGDLHEFTANAMGCDRQIAKSANFGLLYGAGAEGLRNYAGASGVTMTMPEAIKIREDWLQTYQGIRKWQEENAAEAAKTQRTLNKATDAGGTDALPFIRIPLSKMKRLLPGDLNKVTVRCNTPIQGAGAAILKMALGELWKEVYKAGEKEVKIAAAVHDELLLLVKEGFEDKWAEKLSNIMEQAEGIWLDYLTPNEGDIPPLAETSVGKKWSEVH